MAAQASSAATSAATGKEKPYNELKDGVVAAARAVTSAATALHVRLCSSSAPPCLALTLSSL